MGEKWPPILSKIPPKFTLRVILHPKKTYLIIHCDIPKCSYDQCRGLATSVHSIYPTVKPPEFFHIVAPHIQPCSQTLSYINWRRCVCVWPLLKLLIWQFWWSSGGVRWVLVVLWGSSGFWWSFGGPLRVPLGKGEGRPHRGLDGEPLSDSNF